MSRIYLVKFTLVIIIFSLITGCSGGGGGTEKIYPEGNRQKQACFWKISGANTERLILPGVGGYDAEAKSIIVVDGVVYTAGSYYNGQKWIACYWEGTTRRDLETDGASRAESIIVNSGTVYTAGYIGRPNWNCYSCYWRDNTRIELPNDGSASMAYSIATSGDSIYIAGYY